MFTVIVKGTNGCNLNCSYCSLGKKQNVSIVDENRLYDILEFGCKVAKEKNDKAVTFILHGGEPTLIDFNVYSNAINRIENVYKEIKMEYSIQTNAWNISDDYIEFLKEFNINAGVSIDGSKKIHDTERRSKNGEDTFDKVCVNIDRMLDKGLSVSCLMVLTSEALKNDMNYLKYFEKRNLHLKINPLLNYGEVYEHPELTLSENEYADYLIRLYEHVIINEINVVISPIDNILKAILSDRKIHECTFNAKCNENFVCIDYNGNVYPCGKYSDLDEYKLGSIYDLSFSFHQSDVLQKLIKRRTVNLPFKCKTCMYIDMCNAGCNAEASIDGNIEKPPLLCSDYKRLFSYFMRDGLLLYKKKLEQCREELLRNGIRNSVN